MQEDDGEKYLRRITPRENELLNGEISDSEISVMKGASNEVYLVKLKNGGSGVFKPKTGENPGCEGYGIEVGTLYKRERAGYLVDSFLEFDLVPSTVIREINGDIGSFQDFIRVCPTYPTAVAME